MSLWPTERSRTKRPLLLGVSAAGVAYLPSQAPASGWKTWDWGASEDGPTALIDWLTHHAPEARSSSPAVRVSLSPDIAHHWLQPVPDRTQGLAELHAVATATAQRLWSASAPSDWWVSGDWHFQRPFLCTAVPAAWSPAWAAMRARWGVVALHTPMLWHWLGPGRLLWPRDGWVGFSAAQHLFVLCLQRGELMAYRCLRHSASLVGCSSEERATQEARREMRRLGRPPEAVHWLGGAGQSADPLEHHLDSPALQAGRCLLHPTRGAAYGP